ncbi:hypothetical protein [Stygiolobus azoricus]|uniref:ATPase n=1 Tax=Stygiolobus azoricus TaxID=41675 RepID=A0A650CQS6_9CREN|nr:hypothetical protein [Stygiolobus azoricus]QGR20190.1 hypothetical protein D1868_09450 [Stygiolobus azoricus]
MRVLVNGLLQFDSGKTTFSLSLLSTLMQNGIEIFPHKPVAGHNAWYSFSTLLRSEELNALVGNDALKYYDEIMRYKSEKSGITNIINEINPFAVLLAPPDLQKINFDVRLYKELINEGVIVMLRVFDCESVFHFSLQDFEKVIPESLTAKILHLQKIFKATEVSKEKLRELVDSSPMITEKCTRRVFQNYKNVLIESYNDALSPNYASLDVDLMFVVTPGKVFLIEEFKKVIGLFTYPPWIVPVSSFMKYVRVVRSWNIEVGRYQLNDNLLDFVLKFIDKNE